MKTVDEMREYLKGASLSIQTRTEGDVHAITDVTNIDKNLLSRFRRSCAVRQNSLGDGYLAAVILEAILNQKKAMPCATLSARAVRHPNDVPDMLFGRDLARARAKRAIARTHSRALLTVDDFLGDMMWALEDMETEARRASRDADVWLLALGEVSKRRAHVPAVKGE